MKEQNKDIQVFLADPQGSVLYKWKKEGKLERFDGAGKNAGSITEGIGQGRVTKNLEGAPVDDALAIKDDLVIEYVCLGFFLLQFEILKEKCDGRTSCLNIFM